MRIAVLFTVLALLLPHLAGCQGCEDDTAVSGKFKADANVNGGDGVLADGALADGAGGVDGAGAADGVGGEDGAQGGDGGDGGGEDGALSDADGAVAGDAADGHAGSAKLPCDRDGDCEAGLLCGLIYNGVVLAAGDVDGGGVKLPGWDNQCVAPLAGGAKAGELCDPFAADDDASLPVCGNAAACMQGLCTALCVDDGDCPKASACGVIESQLQLDDGQGGKTMVHLPVDICLPLADPKGKLCAGDADCDAGAVCQPWTRRASVSDATIIAEARCTAKNAAKLDVGAACGGGASGKGLAKLCASTICQYDVPGGSPGICTPVCSGASDCPKSMTYGGTSFPTACVGLLVHHGASNAGKPDVAKLADDDVYWPRCVLVNEKSSVVDCADKRVCAGTEACLPFVVAWGPDVAAKTEYRCVEQATKGLPKGPTLDDGADCDPSAIESGCKGGICQAKAGGGGFCTRVCGGEAVCGGGLSCKQQVRVPRADAAKAGVVDICLP